MYEGKDKKEDINFWISYADLMAGLLFVFILVLGAIVIKYVYVQDDLSSTSEALAKQKDQYSKIEKQSIKLNFELAKTKNLFEITKNELLKSTMLNKKLQENLDDTNKTLNLSNEQIVKITKILEDRKDYIKLLDTRIQNQKIRYDNMVKELNFSNNQIEKMKKLLLGYELKIQDYEKNETILKDELNTSKNTIVLKQGELEELTKKLYIQMSEHQKLVDEFDITKIKIKSLTGIRIRVVKALSKKLGSSIKIDSKSGAIVFSSNILFDQGEYLLKEKSKKQLSVILKKYIGALLLDKNIRKYIDNIIIQGHTNSDGSYLYNLELSQKRALEVMKFLYTLDIKNKFLLEKYISASGRSFSNRITDKNGFENKDASRRIEIKFRIKNEDAIKQLSNYLDKK